MSWFRFPHWVVYIACFLLVIASIALAKCTPAQSREYDDWKAPRPLRSELAPPPVPEPSGRRPAYIFVDNEEGEKVKFYFEEWILELWGLRRGQVISKDLFFEIFDYRIKTLKGRGEW